MVLALIPVNSVFAQPKSSIDIGAMLKMTDQDVLSSMLNKGLELPSSYQEDMVYTAHVVKLILSDYKKGVGSPDNIPYNYTELVSLAQNIYRTIGIASRDSYLMNVQATTYTLQDSTVIGSWSDSYLNYNCYSYSLGKTSNAVDPGYYSGGSFSMSLSISAMATLVQNDLGVLGYWSTKTTTKPSSLNSYEYLICIRKGSEDYHFMRSGSTNTSLWRHKPGRTNPLKWKYSSPGYKTWTNENSRYNVCYSGSVTYNSSIYYIRYWSKNGPGPQPSRINLAQE